MEQAQRSSAANDTDPPAAERYLLLADISGYTGFMSGVELAHGVDFSDGIPAAYSVLGALLDTVIDCLEPDFTLVKLEGDAVFAAASAASLDRNGDAVLERLGAMYRAFIVARTEAIPASGHLCTACPAVAHLDLKVVVHRGHSVRQVNRSGTDLLGPAVNIAHRLLKNTIRDRIGFRPYLFVTDAAVAGLGIDDVGFAHSEAYADMGQIQGRVLELGEPTGGDPANG